MRMLPASFAVLAVLTVGCSSPLAGETNANEALSGSSWEFVDHQHESEAAIEWSLDQHFLESLIERKLLHFGIDGSLQSWTVYRDAVDMPSQCSRSQWQWDGTRLRLTAEDEPFTVLAHHDELVLSRHGYRWRYRKLPEMPVLEAGGAIAAAELAGEWRLVESSGGPAVPITIAGYRLSFAADGSGRDDGRFDNRARFSIVDGELMLSYEYVAQSTVTVGITEGSRSEEVLDRHAERSVAVWASVSEHRLTMLLPTPPALLRFERIR